VSYPEDGACFRQRNLLPLFFSDSTTDQTEAKNLCFSCSVPEECLVYGMHEKYGIFGGLLPSERSTLIKLRRSR
jgi:hypothetical protein